MKKESTGRKRSFIVLFVGGRSARMIMRAVMVSVGSAGTTS